MNDSMRFVDQHAGRRHLLDRTSMHHGFAERHSRAHRAADLYGLFAHADRSEQSREQARLLAGDRRGLIDARGAIDAAEWARGIVGRFRGAEKEKPSRIQSVVESGADLFLQFTVEVDE